MNGRLRPQNFSLLTIIAAHPKLTEARKVLKIKTFRASFTSTVSAQ